MTNEPRAAQPTSPAIPASRLPVHPNLGRLREGLDFFRGFLRHPAQVGSIYPSSHQLEQRLVRSARISEACSVVELGPGTGGTTAAFLKAMSPKAQLLAVELDADFHQHLSSTLTHAHFHLERGSAEQLAEFLAVRRMPPPDAIISGIPFSTMPPEVSVRVAAAISQVLRPGGRFVAYQVRAHVAGFVSPYLGQPEKNWEFRNLPPVRVFTWVKPQA